jgi:hypothetical protein
MDWEAFNGSIIGNDAGIVADNDTDTIIGCLRVVNQKKCAEILPITLCYVPSVSDLVPF